MFSKGWGRRCIPARAKERTGQGEVQAQRKASTKVVRGKSICPTGVSTVELAEGDSAEVDERGNAKKKKKK